MANCVENFIDKLEREDLKFHDSELDENTTAVEFPYKGKIFKCVFFGEDREYLSIYTVYESVPEDKLGEAVFTCNELNKKYKWVSFYLDDDNDLMLHLDAKLPLDDDGETAFEMLIRNCNIAEEVKPVIMKAIYA